MEFQAVKGTRDFYPDLMRVRNYIMDAWRRVSLRNGFEEYDSPIFEYLELFTAKSGPEIAEQLFNFTDRGGRSLAILPEITPSLARMVNAKINSLPRPIKWFSMPRVCRGEAPQKGRLREFFQWNIDVIGSDDVLADAECILVCVDLLRELGLTPADVKVHVGSRRLISAMLGGLGLDDAAMQKVLPVLDRKRKLPPEAFRAQVLAAGVTEAQYAEIEKVLGTSPDQQAAALAAMQARGGEFEAAANEITMLGQHLTALGVMDYCQVDLSIVRGLAYYTGIVYEVFDAAGELRAVAGGGRYDNLLQVLGGPKVGATGFGMGDVVLGILLEEKGKLPADLKSRSVDYYVIPGADGMREAVLSLVGRLRAAGRSAEFSYGGSANLGKQLKEANKRGAARAVIVRADGVSVKDFATGEQKDMTVEAFITANHE